MFGFFGYKLAMNAINRVSTFVNNHLEHNTTAVQEGTEVMKEVVTEIRNMSSKLDRKEVSN